MSHTYSSASVAFNPTMVWFYQLDGKVCIAPDVSLSIPLWSDFITALSAISPVVTNAFQSHYGLILSVVIAHESIKDFKTFNPTMVWFYQSASCHEPRHSVRLSIPLWSDFIDGLGKVILIEIRTFNPTMVWFYLQKPIRSLQMHEVLSIPLWSDFIPE